MSEALTGVVAPWYVTALLLVLVVLLVALAPALFCAARTLKPALLGALVSVIAAGTILRLIGIPNQPRIYYDEDRYLTYAVTFARFGQQLGLNAATPQRHIAGDPDAVARITVPTLHAWVLRATRYHAPALFWTAKLVSSLQILLLFIVAAILSRRPLVGLFAASIMAFLPTPVFWSVSIALDSYFVTWSLLTLAACFMYVGRPTLLTAALVTVSTMLLLFVRLEAVLFLPVLVIAGAAIRKHSRQPLWHPTDKLLVAMALPNILFRVAISLSVLGKTWCCGEATPLEAFQLGYFLRNFLPNIRAFFDKPEFPAVITLLALYTLVGKKDWRVWVLIVWIGAFFSLYSFYFAGMFFTYTYSGSYGRYFLILIPPLVIAASWSLVELLPKFRTLTLWTGAALLLAVVSLWPTARHYRSMITLSPYDSLVDAGPRKSRYFLEHVFLREVPPDAIVVHPLTGLTLLHGYTAVYLGSLLSSTTVRTFVHEQALAGKPVYMWQSNTCYAAPDRCEELLKKFRIEEHQIQTDNPTGLQMARLIPLPASASATPQE